MKSVGSWWRTVPGLLTATAGVITAVAGLIVALHQSGLLGWGDNGTSPAIETSAIAPPKSTGRKVVQAIRPWSETTAIITSVDGAVTELGAESLGNCIGSNHELDLTSGQSILFETMRSFEFVRGSATTTLLITLLDGSTVRGSMDTGCDLSGRNKLGYFSISFDKVKRVDFPR